MYRTDNFLFILYGREYFHFFWKADNPSTINSLPFLDSEGSLLCPQNPTSRRYPEPGKSFPRPYVLFTCTNPITLPVHYFLPSFLHTCVYTLNTLFRECQVLHPFHHPRFDHSNYGTMELWNSQLCISLHPPITYFAICADVLFISLLSELLIQRPFLNVGARVSYP